MKQKQKTLALSAITAVFSTIAALPTVAQAAVEQPNLAQLCRTANDVRVQHGLPAIACAGSEKGAGEVSQFRTTDTKAYERTAMKEHAPTQGSAGNLTQW